MEKGCLFLSRRSKGSFRLLLVFSPLFASLAVTPVAGQVSPTGSASSAAAQADAYEQESYNLAWERQDLINQGATPAMLAAWRKKNSARFAALQQQAQSMSTASALQSRSSVQAADVPTDASATMKDYVATQTNLANSRAQIHNQLVAEMSASGQGVTPMQISEMEQKERRLFHQQHAAELKLQRQRERILAQESSRTPITLPAQTAADPSAGSQLVRARIQFENQYGASDAATRRAAMRQWRKQNAALIQEAQKQALSDVGSTQN